MISFLQRQAWSVHCRGGVGVGVLMFGTGSLTAEGCVGVLGGGLSDKGCGCLSGGLSDKGCGCLGGGLSVKGCGCFGWWSE